MELSYCTTCLRNTIPQNLGKISSEETPTESISIQSRLKCDKLHSFMCNSSLHKLISTVNMILSCPALPHPSAELLFPQHASRLI